MSNLFGGVTCEQASAGLSAIACPTHHANAVPVENLDGERVATLCPDCDQGQRLGEITVTQCQTSLYQPGECDCAQAAESVYAEHADYKQEWSVE